MKINRTILLLTAALVLSVGQLTPAQITIAPVDGEPQQPPSLPADPPVPERECIPQSELRTIASHFRQFANVANQDFCNDDSQTWHLLSSIMFMRKTQFSETMAPSQDELFTGRFASSWYDYFIGRINDLRVVNDCPKGVIAYVYMWGNTMYTCPMALTNTFSSLDRASVMMHEARHIDGFPHITCSRGARKGLRGACDDRISKGGSYAVTVETYAQLAKYAQGIHPAMKAYARSSAIVYADEAFEAPVRIGRKESLLALTNDLNFHAIDVQTKELKTLGKSYAAGRIVRRGQHMVLFPFDKTQKVQYIFANDEGSIEQSPSDFITEYNSQTPEQKARLADLHIAAQWSARVYKDVINFSCDPNAPAARDVRLPEGEVAASLVYPEGYARDKYTVQLITESGTLLDIGCNNRQAFVRASAVKLDQPYVRIHKANNQIFGLTATGQLFQLQGETSQAVNTALDGQIVEITPRQSFEFFE